MKIAVFGQKIYGGTGLYRQHLPHEMMVQFGHNVLFTDSTDIDTYKDFDIFMCSKSWFAHITGLVKSLKKNGVITIIDFDDYWVLPPSHILYNDYRKNNTSKILTDGLRLFDYVTCTTPRLQAEIRKINPNVEVFENAIDPTNTQFQVNKVPADTLRFGWVGGHCHEPDINLLTGTPQRLTGNFRIHLFGYDRAENSVYEKFANVLSGDRQLLSRDPVQFYLHDATTSRQYTQFYNYFDVAIVPLVNDQFNSMKSELKLVEAGFMRNAVVVSDVHPYRDLLTDENSLKVVHKQHWAKRMQRLINNPNQVEDMAEALYESVKDKYDLLTVTRRREQWYKTLRPL